MYQPTLWKLIHPTGCGRSMITQLLIWLGIKKPVQAQVVQPVVKEEKVCRLKKAPAKKLSVKTSKPKSKAVSRSSKPSPSRTASSAKPAKKVVGAVKNVKTAK